jgi:hypothetical protein
MSLEILKAKTEEIQGCLTLPIDRSNGDHVAEMLHQLIVIQDLCSQTMALSTMVYTDKIAELYSSPAYSGMSATDKKMVINGKASKEVYYLTLAERLSRSVSHAIDGYRSILSDLKSQRQNYSGM